MPTLSVHVSEEVAASVKEIADERYRGKKSAYVAELIERDLKGTQSTPDAMSETIIEDLARDLNGKLRANILKEYLKGKDQRWVLEGILQDMVDAYKELNASKEELKAAEEAEGYNKRKAM